MLVDLVIPRHNTAAYEIEPVQPVLHRFLFIYLFFHLSVEDSFRNAPLGSMLASRND